MNESHAHGATSDRRRLDQKHEAEYFARHDRDKKFGESLRPMARVAPGAQRRGGQPHAAAQRRHRARPAEQRTARGQRQEQVTRAPRVTAPGSGTRARRCCCWSTSSTRWTSMAPTHWLCRRWPRRAPPRGCAAEAARSGVQTLYANDNYGVWRAEVAEQVGGHLAHLDLLGAFGDAVAAVVAVDVLERLVARIAHAAVHLHGPVGGLAAQPVGPVVAHRDLVGDRPLDLLVLAIWSISQAVLRISRRSISAWVGQLDQRPLDGLVLGQRLAERLALARVLHALVDAVHRRAQRRGRLADAVLVHEALARAPGRGRSAPQ